MDIALEILPRSEASLKEDSRLSKKYSAITMTNVPDMKRFDIRSWEACDIMDLASRSMVPHLRSRDFAPDAPFPLIEFFRRRGITKALVIAGDPEKGEGEKSFPGDGRGTVAFIRKLKSEMPEMEIYGAFDPYRTNIRYELDYLAEKEAAGCAGFMSQPFFDLRLLEIYAEYLEGKRIFWGVAPVLTSGNRNYWESRNRAIFPRSFRPDIFWNVHFARQVLDFCARNSFNIYLMPIKINLEAYLSGIFSA
ncbi:MAG: methylenetetrahydrofolate reductase [Treponema sp.]|jgi:methylenetetrahydrofolate reductase (NADPH)|nr:methylenetetrahydrofolate reductase [Treponema sp.]